MSEDDDHVRRWVRGTTPVPARLTRWQREVLSDPALVADLVRTHGSPLNLIEPSLLAQHADELVSAARESGVELNVYFARKANKALALVDSALSAGHGVDVASTEELRQVLARGAWPDKVIVTAAVKPRELIRLAVAHRVPISVDNLDELDAIATQTAAADHPVSLVFRLAPEDPALPVSRFGLTRAEVGVALRNMPPNGDVVGVHFHLAGYSSTQRAVMLHDALDVVEVVRAQGFRPEFVDMGGGVPIRYLDDQAAWTAVTESLASGAEPLWKDRAVENFYPMWQDPVGGKWIRALLAHRDVGARVRAMGLRLHIEPGRALLNGAGMTLARIEFRKRRRDGVWLVGAAMNRTQVRSAADDFILDPVLVPADNRRACEPMAAFLVGAYCIEDELLTRRRLVFPEGVAVGDTVAFINTAGYMMHIVESTSHQMPLASNVVAAEGGWRVDDIDVR